VDRGVIHPARSIPGEARLGVGMMEEWISRAIPIRRSSTATRVPASEPSGVSTTLSSGARVLLAPPREIWLASLGSASLTLRLMRTAWAHMVAEGARAEVTLRRVLGLGSS